MTEEGDWVLDPFVGTGTSILAAVKNDRRGMGAELFDPYVKLARERVDQLLAGTLRTRPMNRPVYDPKASGNSLTAVPEGFSRSDSPTLFDQVNDRE